MIALYIILGIFAASIAIIVILLHFSIKAYINADKKHIDIAVKYLGFTVYEMHFPDKDKQEEKRASNEQADKPEAEEEPIGFELTEIPQIDSTDRCEELQAAEPSGEEVSADENQEEAEDKPDEKDSKKDTVLTGDRIKIIQQYLPAGKKALKKLCRLLRFYDFRLEMIFGSDDPYKAGLNFGKINTVFYNSLALFCCIFTVKIDKTEIKCDFENKAFDFSFGTTVCVRPSAFVLLLAYVGVYYLIIRRKFKQLDRNIKKENSNE